MLLARFLDAVWEVHASGLGTQELSFYPAMSNLLNEVGQHLQPRVRCVMNLRNAGAGLPDGGLYSGTRDAGVGVESSIPDRAAIEVKPPGGGLDDNNVRDQIERYTSRYGLVLATDLREWRLIEVNEDGFRDIDRFEIAENETAFWRLCQQHDNVSLNLATAFEDFLVRTLLRGAPLQRAADVALLMASYAREARRRLGDSNPAPLKTLKAALEGSLGIKFDRKDGDSFFRSTLLQTLFYGVFSAWVLWSRERERKPGDKFNWHDTQWKLRVPMVRSLFEQISTPTVLAPLHLTNIMDAVQGALNRIDRDDFFAAFDAGHVVQHFYEPFLQAFDPVLRKKMGVWFTPPELVEYMVRRVDAVLRSELGVSGLDDPRVYVLDPCVGTGSFLLATLRLIAERFGEHPTTPMILKDIVLKRLYGFELLPAPYVVAHLQIGMFLQMEGASLNDDDTEGERARVYLTNSLTGWKEQDLGTQHLPIPEFEHERDAANEVKRQTPIWVIIGNPPYDGFSGVSPREEQGLIDDYKRNLKSFGINKHKLDDPYIRFFRIAENRIAHHAPFRGIVCYVSNYSFVTHKSAVLVRKSLLSSFDRIWVDDLHGNRTITEYAPDGRTSETIFNLDGYSPGIKQGVVTSLWLRNNPDKTGDAKVYFRDDFDASRASDRRQQMLDALETPNFDSGYSPVELDAERYYSFKPATSLPQYRSWPSVDQFAAYESSPGPNENRRGALMDRDRAILEARMHSYFSNASNAEIVRLGGSGIIAKAARFIPQQTRDRLRESEGYVSSKIRRFLFRPFDLRWAYLSGEKLWNEGRIDYFAWAPEGTRFVIYRRNGVDENDGPSLVLTNSLGDQHALHKDAYFIPYTITPPTDPGVSMMTAGVTVNLADEAKKYLSDLGYEPALGHEVLWAHALAIAFSASYQRENAGLLVSRPPRIPLPKDRSSLDASAELGRQLTDLLDMAVPVLGVTHGELAPRYANIGKLVRSSASDTRPFRPKELEVRVGWGRMGGNGVVPGRGKIVRYDDEGILDTTDEADDEPSSATEDVRYDVLLNDDVRWSNIPGPVWAYRVAGYRVLKKWLSYREASIKKGPLGIDEAQEFTSIVRRVAAILDLEPALTRNYEAVKNDVYSFPERMEPPKKLVRRGRSRKVGRKTAAKKARNK